MDRKEMSTTEYVSRRNVLKASGWVGGAFALGSSARRVGAQQLNGTIPSRWTVVAIPDTQKYAESSSLVSYAQDQTDWIAAQKNVMNVVFATHEGDIVENGDSVTEWERMSDVMNTLDGEVPYSALLGNHDFAVTGDRESSTENYRTYFGESRYEDYDWFGGTAPDDRGRYQRFDAGGYEFVHLSLEWAVPGSASDSDTTMGWAQDVLDANPTTPTIITTHTHLWDRPDREGHSPRDHDANSGQEIFSDLVAPNPQVFMVLNGHSFRADGEWAQVSQNDADLDVYEMLACYQDYPNGGNGWLRTIEFVQDGGVDEADRIRVRTYSPTLDRFETDDRSRFGFDLDFADRFDDIPESSATDSKRF